MVFSVKVTYQIEDLPQLNHWLRDMEAEEEELDRVGNGGWSKNRY